MDMQPKRNPDRAQDCPNCGISVPGTAENCSCGFVFVGYDGEIAAPAIVRGGGAEPEEGFLELTPEDGPGDETPRAAPKAAAPDSPPRARSDMLMVCPSCGERMSKRARRCPKCGSEPYATCGVCAARILSNTSTCSECGDPDPFGVLPD